jgi:hypothetical protein
MEFHLRQFKFYRKLRGGIWIYIFADISHGFYFWERIKDDESIEYFMDNEPKHHSIIEIEDYSKFRRKRNRIEKIIKKLIDE